MGDVSTSTKLPLRPGTNSSKIILPSAFPSELQIDPEQHTEGVPWLSGELRIAAPQQLTLVVRVHNRAGIPFIEGQTRIEAGQQSFTFTDLHPLGVDAYTHFKEAGRIKNAQRVWSRRAYATLTALSTSPTSNNK